MCVCEYVNMYVCMYVCMYVYVCVVKFQPFGPTQVVRHRGGARVLTNANVVSFTLEIKRS